MRARQVTSLTLFVALVAGAATASGASGSLPEKPGKAIKGKTAAAKAGKTGKTARKGPDKADSPDEAARFFLEARMPAGSDHVPFELYERAAAELDRLPRFSIPAGVALPSVDEARKLGLDNRRLLAGGNDAWDSLGPGNIGGRTRSIVFDPKDPTVIYAGAVDGGVFKSTDSGATWRYLHDLFPILTVSCLAIDPAGRLYAGTGEIRGSSSAAGGGGVFKSEDGGATWKRAGNSSSFKYISKLVVSPGNPLRLYAATEAGVARSTDGGGSWTVVFSTGAEADPTKIVPAIDLVIRTDAGSADDLLVSMGLYDHSGVWRSSDASLAQPLFQRVLGAGEAEMGRTSLARSNGNQNVVLALSASLNTAAGYSGGLHAVFRSEDGGVSWTAVRRNTGFKEWGDFLLTNYRDKCDSAIPISSYSSQGTYDNVIAVDPVNPNVVWAGGIDLFRSTDGGKTWAFASKWNTGFPGFFTHADLHAVTFHPGYNGTSNQRMLVGSDGGIHVTDKARDGGTIADTSVCTNYVDYGWRSLNNAYGSIQFYHGSVFPEGTSFFGGTQDNGTLLGTEALGPEGWSAIVGGDGFYTAIDSSNPSTIYASVYYGDIRKSTDSGKSFSKIVKTGTGTPIEDDADFPFLTVFVLDQGRPGTIWTGSRRPWRSTDGGATWVLAGQDFTTGNFPVRAIAVSPFDSNVVLMGRTSGAIRRTDKALTATSATAWTDSALDLNKTTVSWISFDPRTKDLVYATSSKWGASHVWKSVDGGASWAAIDGNLPDIPVHSIVVDPKDSSRLYIGTDLGVMVSRNGGGTWEADPYFPRVITYCLAVSGDRLFAFTHGRGVFRSKLLTPDPNEKFALPLLSGRVLVTVDWKSDAAKPFARAYPMPQEDRFGFFHFGDPNNPEVFVKVLDFGTGWAVALVGGLTTFEYEVTFTATATLQQMKFRKPANQLIGFANNDGLRFGSPVTGLVVLPGLSARADLADPAGPAPGVAPSPQEDPQSIVLQKNRITVTVDWRNGTSGPYTRAYAIPQKDEFCFFHFGDRNNPEVFVKVLDFGTGKAITLVGGLTTFEYIVTFTNAKGESMKFNKPFGQLIGFADGTSLSF